MKKFFKILLYILVCLLIGFIALGVCPNADIAFIVFCIWLLGIAFIPFIILVIKEQRKMTPQQKAKQKRTLKILGITLLILAITIPLIIFIIYPLLNYLVSTIIDWIFFWHFGPLLAPLN